MKKIIALLAISLITMTQASCTSNESSGDEAVAESDATSTEAVDSELEAVDSGEVATTEDSSENFVDTQPAEEALGEAPADPGSEVASAEAPTEPATTAETAQSDEDLLVADTDSATPAVTEPTPPVASTETTAPATTTDSSATSIDPLVAVETGSTNTGTTEEAPPAAVVEETPAPKPVMASYRKMEKVPFKTAGTLLNSVYVARKGNTFTSISKMIYGSSSKAKDLKKWNPTVSKVNVGDKIYYSSPNRPTDESVILTYFEDTGVAAESYVAQEGDTVRGVASKVLGSNQAWKELYATNDFEEKNTEKLQAGTVVRYWKSASEKPVQVPELASNTGVTGSAATPETVPNNQMPSMATQEPMAPPMDMPPPPTPEAESAQMPPPPPQDASVAQAPPPPMDMPPPPPADVAPPAPVAGVTEIPTSDASAGGFLGLGQEVELALGAGVILAAGLGGLMVVRRRRANREMTSAFSDTQVGT